MYWGPFRSTWMYPRFLERFVLLSIFSTIVCLFVTFLLNIASSVLLHAVNLWLLIYVPLWYLQTFLFCMRTVHTIFYRISICNCTSFFTRWHIFDLTWSLLNFDLYLYIKVKCVDIWILNINMIILFNLWGSDSTCI
jgi:hypothetical protein